MPCPVASPLAPDHHISQQPRASTRTLRRDYVLDTRYCRLLSVDVFSPWIQETIRSCPLRSPSPSTPPVASTSAPVSSHGSHAASVSDPAPRRGSVQVQLPVPTTVGLCLSLFSANGDGAVPAPHGPAGRVMVSCPGPGRGWDRTIGHYLA
jgi:hypothetical protein